MISDIITSDNHNEVSGLMNTGAFTKELMGETIRNLGDTIKQEDDHQTSQNSNNWDVFKDDQSEIQADEPESQEVSQMQAEGDEEDVIDIDNPAELEARGLKRIQIEGEEEEFLMDQEGNIYDLQGNFIGTTEGDGDNENEESSALDSMAGVF